MQKSLIGAGEGESTPGGPLSVGHNPTPGSSALGAGYEPTQGSAFGAGHEPTQTDPWYGRGGSAQPAGPYEEDTAIFNVVEACQAGLTLVDPLRPCSGASSGERSKNRRCR